MFASIYWPKKKGDYIKFIRERRSISVKFLSSLDMRRLRGIYAEVYNKSMLSKREEQEKHLKSPNLQIAMGVI